MTLRNELIDVFRGININSHSQVTTKNVSATCIVRAVLISTTVPDVELATQCANALLTTSNDHIVIRIAASRLLASPDTNVMHSTVSNNTDWERTGSQYSCCWHAIAVDLVVEGIDNVETVTEFRNDHRTQLLELSKHGIDLCIVPYGITRAKLCVFDMDSTLISQEVIDEIAIEAGPTVANAVAEITERAMHGLLDFSESLRQRAAALTGISANDLVSRVRARITPTPGAIALCRVLRAYGTRLAVVSGGFIPFGRYVQYTLGLDFAFANTLEIVESNTQNGGKMLSGRTGDPIVDANRKRRLLLAMCKRDVSPVATNEAGKLIAGGNLLESNDLADKQGKEENETIINPKTEAVACGDGANDLQMMEAAGLSIAFRAKPQVNARATCWISHKRIDCYLFFLGLTADEIKQLFIQGSKDYNDNWEPKNRYLLDCY